MQANQVIIGSSTAAKVFGVKTNTFSATAHRLKRYKSKDGWDADHVQRAANIRATSMQNGQQCSPAIAMEMAAGDGDFTHRAYGSVYRSVWEAVFGK